jgi:Raf kinase inhibitor-like YbhB/YbcL family protein
MTMKLSSTAFQDGGMIPSKYTCDGPNISPPLNWSGLPANTKSIALIVDDPDAPAKTWVHWVLYDLPSTQTELAEDIKPHAALAAGGRQGTNDFRQTGYGGPCPPGGTHRYFFKIYALDSETSLKDGATKDDVERAMKGHVLGQGELVGKYQRR